jgi:hypothetical protein
MGPMEMIEVIDEICLLGLEKPNFTVMGCVTSMSKVNRDRLWKIIKSEDDDAKADVVAAFMAHKFQPVEIIIIELIVALDVAQGLCMVLGEGDKQRVFAFSLN